jgi:Flp pilus assembly pilin Flp
MTARLARIAPIGRFVAALRLSSSDSELTRGRLGSGRGDHGATAVEYGLMVALIAVAIIVAVTLFGQNMIGLFGVPTSALNP